MAAIETDDSRLAVWECWCTAVHGAGREIVWDADQVDPGRALMVLAGAFDRSLAVIDLGCGGGQETAVSPEPPLTRAPAAAAGVAPLDVAAGDRTSAIPTACACATVASARHHRPELLGAGAPAQFAVLGCLWRPR